MKWAEQIISLYNPLNINYLTPNHRSGGTTYQQCGKKW